MTKPNQTLAERSKEVGASLARLRASIAAGRVQITIAPNGAIGLTGWKDRDDVTDVCAVRTLTAEGSWELRQAIVKAEARQGRRANMQATAQGWHSHDDGKTWGRH
jgi:hypothetical protein